MREPGYLGPCGMAGAQGDPSAALGVLCWGPCLQVARLPQPRVLVLLIQVGYVPKHMKDMLAAYKG